MISCPKCGFDQPKDQYCAKCGIDMTLYQPKRKNIITRVLLAPVFHIGIILIGVILISFYIFRSEEIKWKQNSEEYKHSEAHIVQIKNDLKLGGEKIESSSEVPQSATESLRSDDFQQKEERVDKSENSDEAMNSLSEKGMIRPKLELILVEIKKSYLDEIYDRLETKTRYSNSSAGIINSFNDFFQNAKKDQAIRLLDQFAQLLPPMGQTFEFSKGAQDLVLDKEVGVKFKIKLLLKPQNLISFRIRLLLELKEYQGEEPLMGTQTIDEEFELPPGSAIVLSGILPHRGYFEDEENSFRSTFLRILGSSDFQKQRSEFAIFFLIKGDIK